MFQHLSLEIRLLIWEAVISQPRVIFINLRPVKPEPFDTPSQPHEQRVCDTEYFGPEVCECVCRTAIPVLLHLCSESRKFALSHYELAFGRPIIARRKAWCRYRDPFSYRRPLRFSLPSPPRYDYQPTPEEESQGYWIPGNEDEVARYRPKVYVNFENDIVCFGETFSHPSRPKSGPGGDRFPYETNLKAEDLRRVEKLAVCYDLPGIEEFIRKEESHPGNLGVKLRELYLCISGDNFHPEPEVELVDLKDKDFTIAKTILFQFGHFFCGGLAPRIQYLPTRTEGVRDLWQVLQRRDILRNKLLANGANPEEILHFVSVRNVEKSG